jgi:hypothetical protein
MQRKAYALVGAAPRSPPPSARCSEASSRRTCRGASRSRRGRDHRDRPRRASRLVHDVPYTGERGVDVVGSILSAVGMGGVVLGILVWESGGGAVVVLIAVGAVALGSLVWWLRRRKREGRPALLDVALFASKYFRLGISGQTLQQIALGGLMIALPIYLQMVLEYNAMEAGLSLAPLSLTMFAVALVAGRKAGTRSPSHIIRAGFALLVVGVAILIRSSAGALGLGDGRAADDRRRRPRPARLAAQQLHARADRGGARQRGRRRQLGRRLVRALVRPRVRRRDHARVAVARLHQTGDSSDVLSPAQQEQVATALETNAEVMTNTAPRGAARGTAADVQAEILRINTTPADRAPDRAARAAHRRPCSAS